LNLVSDPEAHMGKVKVKCPECDTAEAVMASDIMSRYVEEYGGHVLKYSAPIVKRRYFCEGCDSLWEEFLRKAPKGAVTRDSGYPGEDEEDEDGDGEEYGGGYGGVRTLTRQSRAPELSREDKFAKALREKASEYGLMPEHLNCSIEIKSVRYQIIGLNTRKKKYPVVVRETGTNKITFYSLPPVLKALNISSSVLGKLEITPSQEYAKCLREHAAEYGLTPEDLGREFTIKRTTYKIDGINPRRKKNPIVVSTNGKQYFAPLDFVQKALACPAQGKSEALKPEQAGALDDIPANEFSFLLQKAGARDAALTWAQGKTFLEFWVTCHIGNWMLALAGFMAGQPGWPTKQQVSLAACKCAETAIKYAPIGANLPRSMVGTVEKWICGEASDLDVVSARDRITAVIKDGSDRDPAVCVLKASRATANLIGSDGGSIAFAAAYTAMAASAKADQCHCRTVRLESEAACAEIVRTALPLSKFSFKSGRIA
jgi:hypothetical protein